MSFSPPPSLRDTSPDGWRHTEEEFEISPIEKTEIPRNATGYGRGERDILPTLSPCVLCSNIIGGVPAGRRG